MLEVNAGHENGHLHLKIAHCYLSLNERVKAIHCLYKALCTLENNVDAWLTLASLLLEEEKEDEVFLIAFSTNISRGDSERSYDQSRPWWLNGKVKLIAIVAIAMNNVSNVAIAMCVIL
ncbi:hypothetical protein L1049_027593 [Liquidambar formosana]|uniref:Uncharacterized protein n=1 Tax=Liquidambar formosana TaxID=63359 RepID=A0AAP0WV89_LIQFO